MGSCMRILSVFRSVEPAPETVSGNPLGHRRFSKIVVKCSSTLFLVNNHMSITPRAQPLALKQARYFFRPHRRAGDSRTPCGRFQDDLGNENLRPEASATRPIWSEQGHA